MRIPLIAVILGVSAFAPLSYAEESPLQGLTRLLVGDYFSAADGGVKEGRPIYMRIRSIQSPVPNKVALYAEMRHDGPNVGGPHHGVEKHRWKAHKLPH